MLKRVGIGLLVLVALCGGLLFSVVAPIIDSRMNRVEKAPLRDPSADAIALHRTIGVADLHGDLLLWPRSVLTRGSRGHEDLPRMQEGGMVLQVFSSVTKAPRGLNYEHNDSTTDQIQLMAIASRWPMAAWSSRVERALYQAGKFAAAAEASGGQLVPIRSAADLARLLAARATNPKLVGALLSIEGLHASEGRGANLDRLYDAGFRMMGLTHFFDNEVGGSSAGMVKGGLTPFGRQAIRWMEGKRVIVDLAHASPATIDETLGMVTRPVVVSHMGVKGTCPGPRNLSDDQIRRIAATGGVIGIGFWDAAICGTSPDSVAAAIRYTVSVAGIDHVGLGSDFDGATTTAFDVSRMVLITDALLKAGLAVEDVRKVMGGNVVRLLMENLPPG